MKLKKFEKENILKNFPKIELSYEKLLHKKVDADIYLTIPKGKNFLLGLELTKDTIFVY